MNINNSGGGQSYGDSTPTLGEVASSAPFVNNATHDSGESGSGCEEKK